MSIRDNLACMHVVCQLDAEYELEEVWDGKQWHVTKKLVPKKPASSKDSEKPRELTTEITFCSIMMITSQSNPIYFQIASVKAS